MNCAEWLLSHKDLNFIMFEYGMTMPLSKSCSADVVIVNKPFFIECAAATFRGKVQRA